MERSTESIHSQEVTEYILPPLFDLQVNGYGGVWFTSPSLREEEVRQVARGLAQTGVAKFCPTLTTSSRECTLHSLRTIAAACKGSSTKSSGDSENGAELAEQIPGIHLEGPYISAEDGPRGAHPLRWCRAPDRGEFRDFQDAAQGRIRIVTLSPEYDTSIEFIGWLVDQGIRVAIGHTSATPEQIHAAVDAGASFSTHLGNGSHAVLPRLRNYLWAQLADERLSATLIADGFHLPDEPLQVFLRCKGPQRACLVSDLAGVAGLPPGEYRSELCRMELLEDGRLVVAGQREFLAGAASPLLNGVANLVTRFGYTLEDAWRLASIRPAEIFDPTSIDPTSTRKYTPPHLPLRSHPLNGDPLGDPLRSPSPVDLGYSHSTTGCRSTGANVHEFAKLSEKRILSSPTSIGDQTGNPTNRERIGDEQTVETPTRVTPERESFCRVQVRQTPEEYTLHVLTVVLNGRILKTETLSNPSREPPLL